MTGIAFGTTIPEAEDIPFDNSTNGFASNNVQDAIEESKDVALNVRGKLLDFEFSTIGVTINRWANVNHPSQPSNISPYVSEWAGQGIAMSYSNKNDDTDIDIEYYVNGTLEYTWTIRNKRTAWKAYINEGSPLFSIAQGDRVSIYCKKVTGGTGGNPANINGELISVITTMANGDGGTQTGV